MFNVIKKEFHKNIKNINILNLRVRNDNAIINQLVERNNEIQLLIEKYERRKSIDKENKLNNDLGYFSIKVN